MATCADDESDRLPRAAVVVLAKPPRAGRSKTRLVTPDGLSPAAAAEFAAACLSDLTSRLAGAAEWPVVVQTELGGAAAVAPWLPGGVSIREDGEPTGDLGQVLREAVASLLADGFGAVLLVGCDCPHLPVERVREAVAALREHDLVLGPDDGGGCYLIGTRRPLDLVAAAAGEGALRWSAGTDCQELQQRAARQGWRTVCLAPSYDLDRPADLRRLQGELTTGVVDRGQVPAVAAFLTNVFGQGESGGR